MLCRSLPVPVPLVIALLLVAAPLSSHAEEGSVYGGAVTGAWAVRPQATGVGGQPPSPTSSLGRESERYAPSQLFGGIRINDSLSLEGARTTFGVAPGAGERSLLAPGTLSVSGVGSVPLDSRTSLVGKVGVHYWQPDAAAPSLDLSHLATPGIVYGVGLRAAVTKEVQVQVLTERYQDAPQSAGTVNVLMFGVSAEF